MINSWIRRHTACNFLTLLPLVAAPLLALLLLTAAPFLLRAAPGVGLNPSSVFRLDPNQHPHPDSSLGDFRELLDAPAGKHGFLTVQPDGHFYFQDGTRARFWGINIAASSVFQPQSTIDQVVDVLARAGINLVRIHDIDDLNGIIDYAASDSQHFSLSHLHSVDYWIWRCRQAGIYVYLDLLDYRTFKKGDEVSNAPLLGRGAKPYALFDTRLIELQKEYARHLLIQHINPFTHLSYAQDPTVCMLELYDENGLFIKRTVVDKLIPPYQSELAVRWSNWLRDRYHTTANLARAWTNEKGERALQRGESLEQSTVRLPKLLLRSDWDRSYSDPAFSPARVNEASLFAYMVQANYCLEMKAFLRRQGVRIPMTTVGSQDAIPDLKSIGDTLDFIGNNFYWDHPTFPKAGSWRLPSFFHNRNPLESIDEYSFAPTTAFSKIRGKPLVLREWNYCWPNSYRDAGMLEAAVYSCLQDVDAMILFSYDTRPDHKELSYFDVSHDPSRWSFVGPLAAVFLRRLVSPARLQVDIGYSYADVFHYYGYISSVYDLGWQSRVENAFFNDTFPQTEANAVVASGHSAAAAYRGTHCIIRTNNHYEGLGGRLTEITTGARSGYRLPCDPVPPGMLSFSGDLMPYGTTEMFETGQRYRTSTVVADGCTPLGVTADASHCLGFYDPVRQNYVFQNLDEVDALRAALDGLHRWYRTPNDSTAVHRDRIISDTGELTRDSATGILQVDTPGFQAIAGHLRPSDIANGSEGLRVHSESNEGTVIALALDGRPLARSRRFLVAMATAALNTGQASEWPAGGKGHGTLVEGGSGPVKTGGAAISQPTEIWLGTRQLASVYLHGGTWMMLQDGRNCTFYCDTPQVKVEIARFSNPQIIEPEAAGALPPAPTAVVSASTEGGFLTPSPGAFVRLESHG